MAGRAGVDTIVALPPGTIVRRRDAGPDEPPLAELLEPGALEDFRVWVGFGFGPPGLASADVAPDALEGVGCYASSRRHRS
jgi:hypothetical protein